VRVPFGVKNAPAFFQRAITKMLAAGGITHSKGFIDDIMTGGETWSKFLDH
jgi:hypothetical protein